MRILQIDAARFGALSIDSPIKFSPGLNLWISGNQAGKTTLLTFLEWMLYGPQSQRGQRDASALQRWTPWAGGQPTGRIIVQPELPDWPGEMMISVRFSDYFVQVSEYRTQKTLVDRVNVAKSGEWDLGLQLLNLSRDSFRLSLQALQETLVEPLRGGSLRQMVTSDLGKLVENPDVAAVDRILATLENPVFKLGLGPAATIREHQTAVTKELDLLGLERIRLEQRLGEFRELLGDRDALTAQLEQQERVVQGLERQTRQLDLARSHYLLRGAGQAAAPPAEDTDWQQQHPEYLQITAELEQEVTELSSQLELATQELERNQAELAHLESQYEQEQRRLAGSGSSQLSAQQLRTAAAAVEAAYEETRKSRQRCKELADQVPEGIRARYEELEKLYREHHENLSAIIAWQKDRSETDQRMVKLRERRAELQIMSRVNLPWYFYLGLFFAAFSWILLPLGGQLGLFDWIPWMFMAILLAVAAILTYPYWKLRRATGPAATELRTVVKPQIDAVLEELAAQDRRRRRFLEDYGIERPIWDALVDNIMEFQQLDLRMREYNSSLRDLDMQSSRLSSAWVAIGELHPLAPPVVDMGWLREQLEFYSGGATAPDALATLQARIDDCRKDVARLSTQQQQYEQALAERLAPVGFAAQLQQGLRQAVDGFRQAAQLVRRHQQSAERQSIYEESARAMALDEGAFHDQWRQLTPVEQERLSQLAATREGFDTVCTRLTELGGAVRDATAQRDKLRGTVEQLREQLTDYARIDREAQQVNDRRADAERRHALLERWDKALNVTRRIIESLVDRAGAQAAPEIEREMKKTLDGAPISGVKDVSLGPKLELLVKIEGAPASIPPARLWTYLSTGAQKQVALALRLAMARTASGRTSLPLLLDEPLEELDDERAELVFSYVARLADSSQVLLMTCHERLYRWLLERHGEAHELDIPTRV